MAKRRNLVGATQVSQQTTHLGTADAHASLALPSEPSREELHQAFVPGCVQNASDLT